MKILILGDYILKENRFVRLKRHIKIKNWDNFINYIKKYKEKEKEND